MPLDLLRMTEPQRHDCCDFCLKEWDCIDLIRRCGKIKGGSCRVCLHCEQFESKTISPFVKALEIIEGGRR